VKFKKLGFSASLTAFVMIKSEKYWGARR